MKKIIAGLLLLVLAVAQTARSETVSFTAQVTENLVQSFPSDLVTMRIAVIPLENDKEQKITNSLLAAIVASKKYTILERDKIDEILKEQGLQTTDLVDYQTAVKVGSLAGAEAIITGNLKKIIETPLFASVNMHLRIVHVETGKILWSQNIDERWVPPTIKKSMPVVLLLVLLLIALSLRRQIMLGEKKQKLGKDLDIRENTVHEIEKIANNLSFAQNALFEKGEKDMARKIKDLSLSIDQLKLKVKTADFGVAAEKTGGQIRRAVKIDSRVFDSIASLTSISRDIKEKATSNPDKNSLERQIAKTNSLVIEIQNRFTSRKNSI